MPYIKATTKAGKTITVKKYYSSRYGMQNIPRGANVLPTTEAQQRINDRIAADKLTNILNENFKGGDFHAVLTYRPTERPTDEETARQTLKGFMRQLRREYRRNGKNLFYVHVTEGKHKAIHHHVVLTGINPDIITRLWRHGRVRFSLLDNSGQYRKLAEYLIKETCKSARDKRDGKIRRRWSASRNIRRPKEKKEIVKADKWKDEPKPPKGWYIDRETFYSGMHELTGFAFQQYTLVRLE